MAIRFSLKDFRNAKPTTVPQTRMAGGVSLAHAAAVAAVQVAEGRKPTAPKLAGKVDPLVRETIEIIRLNLARKAAAFAQGDPIRELLLINIGPDARLAHQALTAAQRTFEFLSPAELEKLRPLPTSGPIGEGLLSLGRHHLRAIILPSTASAPRYLVRLLMRYQAAGGHIILIDNPPALLDGKPNTTMMRFFDTLPRVALRGLAPLLKALAPPLLRFYGPDEDDRRSLRASILAVGRGQLLVHLVNYDPERAFSADVIVAGRYAEAAALDSFTGEAIPLRTCALAGDARGALLFQLPFASWQDHLILLSPQPVAGSVGPISLLLKPVSERAELLPELWTEERDGTGRITFAAPLPHLSGKGWRIELGQLEGAMAEISIGDNRVGLIWKEPFEVELPPVARRGDPVKITVAPLPGAPAVDVSPVRFIKR